MKTENEIRKFYEEMILPDLKPLEVKRTAALRKIILFVIVMIVAVMAALGVLGSHQAPGPAIFGTFVAFIAAVVAGIKILRFDIAGEFKRIAISKLVSFIDPALSYDAQGSVPRDAFIASSLFTRRFKLYHGTDLVTVTRNGFQMALSKLLVMATRSRGGNNTARNTVFNGIFITAGPAGNATARVLVVPQLPSHHLGRLVNKLTGLMGSEKWEVVSLNDGEFERIFAVYANKPGEAKSILSADMRGRIMRLRELAGSTIAVSFAGSKTYVAVSCGGNVLDAHLTRSVLDQDSMEENFKALQLAGGIAEDLALP